MKRILLLFAAVFATLGVEAKMIYLAYGERENFTDTIGSCADIYLCGDHAFLQYLGNNQRVEYIPKIRIPHIRYAKNLYKGGLELWGLKFSQVNKADKTVLYRWVSKNMDFVFAPDFSYLLIVDRSECETGVAPTFIKVPLMQYRIFEEAGVLDFIGEPGLNLVVRTAAEAGAGAPGVKL